MRNRVDSMALQDECQSRIRARIGILVFLSLLFIWGLPSSPKVTAQSNSVSSTGIQAVDMVAMDEDISGKDLGVGSPRILLGSRMYFLKNISRFIRGIATFNAFSKARLELKVANEKIIEFKLLVSRTSDPRILERAFRSYARELERIQKRTEHLPEDDDDRIDRFLDTLVSNLLLHHKLIGRLEKDLPHEVFKEVEEVKGELVQLLSIAVLRFDSPEEFAKRLEELLEKQDGSPFKSFKSLEVLKEVEENAPEEAKGALRAAEDRLLRAFSDTLGAMPQEDRSKFRGYVQHIGGNETRHLEIIRLLRERDSLDSFDVEMQQARQDVFLRIKERVQKFSERSDAELYLKYRGELDIEFMEAEEAPISPSPQEKPPTSLPGEEPVREERVCIQLFDPVCGADGRTYSNECFANLSRVEIAYRGECGREPETVPPSRLPSAMPPYLSPYSSQGYTVPAPSVCSKSDPLVCGVDGNMYANRCIAEMFGVAVKYIGHCATGTIPSREPASSLESPFSFPPSSELPPPPIQTPLDSLTLPQPIDSNFTLPSPDPNLVPSELSSGFQLPFDFTLLEPVNLF